MHRAFCTNQSPCFHRQPNQLWVFTHLLSLQTDSFLSGLLPYRRPWSLVKNWSSSQICHSALACLLPCLSSVCINPELSLSNGNVLSAHLADIQSPHPGPMDPALISNCPQPPNIDWKWDKEKHRIKKQVLSQTKINVDLVYHLAMGLMFTTGWIRLLFMGPHGVDFC